MWMKRWSNSTRAGHAAIPDSRRPDIRIGRDLDTVLATIKKLHETLHAEGTQRLSTAIKIGTRTDKHARLEDKLFTA